MFAKIINDTTKEVQIVSGEMLVKYLGAKEMEVEQAWNGNWYIKGHAPQKPVPNVEEQVEMREAKTGLTRAVRELVLAPNSGVSDYLRQQAQEIETLAAPLREVPNE